MDAQEGEKVVQSMDAQMTDEVVQWIDAQVSEVAEDTIMVARVASEVAERMGAWVVHKSIAPESADDPQSIPPPAKKRLAFRPILFISRL